MPNLATGFRNCVIENTANVFLGQGHFEEVVSFQVNSDEAAISIVVFQTHEDGGVDQQTHHLVDSRKMTLLCAKNPVVAMPDGSRSDWQTIRGYPFLPALGNLFARADGSRWGFSRIQAEDFASWTMTFVSQKILRSGSKPMGM